MSTSLLYSASNTSSQIYFNRFWRNQALCFSRFLFFLTLQSCCSPSGGAGRNSRPVRLRVSAGRACEHRERELGLLWDKLYVLVQWVRTAHYDLTLSQQGTSTKCVVWGTYFFASQSKIIWWPDFWSAISWSLTSQYAAASQLAPRCCQIIDCTPSSVPEIPCVLVSVSHPWCTQFHKCGLQFPETLSIENARPLYPPFWKETTNNVKDGVDVASDG